MVNSDCEFALRLAGAKKGAGRIESHLPGDSAPNSAPMPLCLSRGQMRPQTAHSRYHVTQVPTQQKYGDRKNVLILNWRGRELEIESHP